MVNILISLDKDTVTAISINVFTTLFIFVTSNLFIFIKRKSLFNKDFLLENFGNIHNKAFGTEINEFDYGFPDCGNGYYSKKLKFEDWYELNQLKRIYESGIDMLSIFLFIHFIISLIYPKFSIFISFLFLLGRVSYFVYYFSNYNIIFRVIGTLTNLFCIFMCLGIIFYNIFFK